MRRIAVLSLLALAVGITVQSSARLADAQIPRPATAALTAAPAPPLGCRAFARRSSFRRVARGVFTTPAIGPRHRRRLARAGRCLTPDGKVWARRLSADLRSWRRSYAGYWRLARKRLSPGIRATLARLRGCETRGIPYPRNYRHDGHHDGAYQYTVSTWARAQTWAGVPGRYRRAPAFNAAPAHQDVVTARFFPAHRGEWACSA